VKRAITAGDDAEDSVKLSTAAWSWLRDVIPSLGKIRWRW